MEEALVAHYQRRWFIAENEIELLSRNQRGRTGVKHSTPSSDVPIRGYQLLSTSRLRWPSGIVGSHPPGRGLVDLRSFGEIVQLWKPEA